LTSPRPRISPAPRRPITTSAFSTKAGNELLLAFISTDYLSGTNTKVNSITGAGLTWVLVVRTNGQNRYVGNLASLRIVAAHRCLRDRDAFAERLVFDD